MIDPRHSWGTRLAPAAIILLLAYRPAAAQTTGYYSRPEDSIRVEKYLLTADSLPFSRRDSALLLARMAAQVAQESIKGGDHPDLAVALRELGRFGINQGRYEEAERALRNALTIVERIYPETDPARADVVDYLARAVRLQGKLPEAERLYREALALKHRIYLKDDPELAGGMNNLALMLKGIGRFAESDSLYREALAMKIRMYGGDHEDLATGLLNLGALALERGRIAESIAFLDSALAMLRRLGVERPLVAAVLATHAIVDERIGCLDLARRMATQALLIRRKVYPPLHPSTAGALATLAAISLAEGDVGNARRYADTALRMRIELFAFEKDHPDLAASLALSGRVARNGDDLKAADSLLRAALEMMRRLNPKGSLPMISVLNELGRTHAAMKEETRADADFKEAIATARRVSDEDLPATALAMAHRGELDLTRARSAEGISELRASWELYTRMRAETLAEGTKTLEALEAALRRSGEKAEAERLRGELERIARERGERCESTTALNSPVWR